MMGIDHCDGGVSGDFRRLRLPDEARVLCSQLTVTDNGSQVARCHVRPQAFEKRRKMVERNKVPVFLAPSAPWNLKVR